ncbi:MAG: FeoA family protein [Methanocalculus sp.]|uniref:FeoA family protein n=1 Tax=Methanocalculus sp. TaxID=2004547 RepID=UPI0027273DB1|nr:FeoA family protein [Methanocalculus sp.]MDO9539152.1 FeoA family protein [Methanocalculus sp.]
MTSCPLSLAAPGTTARIAAINAGEGLRRRFYDLGLIPDAEVTVVTTDRGSIIVSVAGCRYALSRGMAMKIQIAPEMIAV